MALVQVLYSSGKRLQRIPAGTIVGVSKKGHLATISYSGSWVPMSMWGESTILSISGAWRSLPVAVPLKDDPSAYVTLCEAWLDGEVRVLQQAVQASKSISAALASEVPFSPVSEQEFNPVMIKLNGSSVPSIVQLAHMTMAIGGQSSWQLQKSSVPIAPPAWLQLDVLSKRARQAVGPLPVQLAGPSRVAKASVTLLDGTSSPVTFVSPKGLTTSAFAAMRFIHDSRWDPDEVAQAVTVAYPHLFSAHGGLYPGDGVVQFKTFEPDLDMDASYMYGLFLATPVDEEAEMGTSYPQDPVGIAADGEFSFSVPVVQTFTAPSGAQIIRLAPADSSDQDVPDVPGLTNWAVTVVENSLPHDKVNDGVCVPSVRMGVCEFQSEYVQAAASLIVDKLLMGNAQLPDVHMKRVSTAGTRELDLQWRTVGSQALQIDVMEDIDEPEGSIICDLTLTLTWFANTDREIRIQLKLAVG